ncbi:hypothetical protein PHMEG_0004558 [Phytophthora megakarya]|uniref:Uncharacterized protein n=1 Tax=Phytophthora megakarya TaxID=4795 RepID=A0A225WTJ3_9STRA|nr:hypothetical protein PHMEG_0004558 [Phytophthora megakarya]
MEADEAMVPHYDSKMLVTVYPPLPLYSDVDLRRLRRRQGSEATIPSVKSGIWLKLLLLTMRRLQSRTKCNVSRILWRHKHSRTRKRSMTVIPYCSRSNKRYVARSMNIGAYRLLKAAEVAVELHGQQLEGLTEAVQSRLQGQWGAFAQGADPSTDSRSTEEPPAVTVKAGTIVPGPPIYRCSSKKERRGFVDSYAIYIKRMKALNQEIHTRFFVVALSACIEQGITVKINFLFRLFEVEKDRIDYFLSARVPDNIAYKTLDQEEKLLIMGINIQDAELRLSRLMAYLYEIVGRLIMEDGVQGKPKKVVRTTNPTKSNNHTLLKWLRTKLDGFVQFDDIFGVATVW